jgi:hypothetical protein
MKKLGIAALLAIATSGAAFAKDVCVHLDGGSGDIGDIVFKSVKRLKPGGAVALSGLWAYSTDAIPVSGTAVMRSDGKVEVGVQLFSLGAFGGTGVMAAAKVTADDATFVGSGFYENEDDGGNNTPDGNITFASIDCATIVLP